MTRSIALAAALFALAAAPAAGAAPKPDLRVSSIAPAVTTIIAGQALSVATRTVNAGRGRAAPSRTALFLSGDAKRDARDRRLVSRRLGTLRAGRSVRAVVLVRIPPATAAGTYRLIACADVLRRVRERSEANNCRVASRALTVTVPAPAGGTTTPQPGSQTTTPGSTTPAPGETTTPTAPAPAVPPAEQIASARAAADGTTSLPVGGAVVTYVKPEDGDPAGFFVQALQTGPALFVAVDPAGAAAAGDRVSFTITEMATVASQRRATAVTALTKTESGVATAPLMQPLSTATDVVTNLGAYESELVGAQGTIATAFGAAGLGHLSARLDTTGISGDANLQLRLPSTVVAAIGLRQGCVITLQRGFVWRFNAVAQLSAAFAADVVPASCPAPRVVSANAASPTTVVVTFDRQISAASVNPNGSQFTVDNGLAVTHATVSGTQVTLTTTAQTASVGYTVTVAQSVQDTLGAGVDPANDTASFNGHVQQAVLRINEVAPNISSSKDLIELVATAGGTLDGITVRQKGGATDDVLATLPNVVVANGDLVVVHLNPATTTCPNTEALAKNQYSAATNADCYDGAWDVAGNAIGITYNARVLSVKTPVDGFQDAVAFALPAGTPAAGYATAVQEIQAAAQWLPANCGGALCTTSSTPSVLDVSADWTAAGTSKTGDTVRRVSGTDTNAKGDWAVGAQTLGAANS